MAHLERAKLVGPGPMMPPVNGRAAFTGRAPVSRGKAIVVYSPKGGTGCTTLAVNLALTLHNEDTRAVLVDGNLQFGDVAVL
jgi:pilus assembly protein CpaE